MAKIEAIQVPFTPYLSYGIKKDGTIGFVYAHKTERAANMTTSRIGNGTHKHWDASELLSWGWIVTKDIHHTEGIWV